MLNIVYYTGSITGAGRLIIGTSIGYALRRRSVDCSFTLLHSSNVEHLDNEFESIRIPLEHEGELSTDRYIKSVLYKTLRRLKPDVLIINHQWFMVHSFIKELNCKKIYLSDLVYDSFFSIPLPGETITFNPDNYDHVYAIEPFKSSIKMERINPLVVRNHDELFPREKALHMLGLEGDKKVVLCATGAYEEDFDIFRKKYPFLNSDEHDVIFSSMKTLDHFPLADLYNGIDIIIGLAGYNQVWEAVYFGKEAYFEARPKKHSDQSVRVKESRNFTFQENGSDQLVDIISKL